MARARNIKPAFFRNELLAELSPATRLLFIGLWCLADREGRLEDRPKKIKLELVPFDDIDVVAAIDDLEKTGFIERYEVAGLKLIQVVNFLKHQTPHGTERDSEFPDQDGNLTVHTRGKNGYITNEQQGDNRALTVKAPGKNALNPDSLNPDSLNPERPPKPPKGPDLFDEFWSAYPLKVGKDAARKAFEKRKPDRPLVDSMLAAIAKQKQTPKWQEEGGQYIPHPTTWLNQGRWQDEGAPQRPLTWGEQEMLKRYPNGAPPGYVPMAGPAGG